jgi:hypothetical protein
MRFTPTIDDEIDVKAPKRNLLPAGFYEYEIMNAEEKTSQKGNLMLAIKLNVFKGDLNAHIYDHIVQKYDKKLKLFCLSAGLKESYKAGILTDIECVGRKGMVKIGIETDPKGEYSDKNKVLYYVPQQNNDEPMDEIPF